ncbi:MAG TPA: non-heme iron oxygenase ferredoxin subunit [Actinomycetes bacterium]|nr:non-heme iron oxygenase ferredoxin subunit [Actinomycetes bacterium]
MPFVRLAGLSELQPDAALRVELDEDNAVALVHTAAGEVYALNDVCTHEEYPLSEGWVEDRQIECALHGSRFDLKTGDPDVPPAVVPVRTYPVRVEGDDVLVDLPDALATLLEG